MSMLAAGVFNFFFTIILSMHICGETGRGFNTSTSAHWVEVRLYVLPNVLMVYVDEVGHLPKYKDAGVIQGGLNKHKK